MSVKVKLLVGRFNVMKENEVRQYFIRCNLFTIEELFSSRHTFLYFVIIQLKIIMKLIGF